ncbi:hypothetical protein P154DRAFT_321076 [Amniculicola lignicola CBS 123094]|uniref:Uncharacterized protein n=1 Tax=Amniculicola lignicola CBS 123094 TaxID=1392246 RepID=A0A6A5WB37_9PLEO|nr:hypothetical protein P154DRAFT_321076 [Amniculicola lignicola CBS 123094]
MRLVDGRYEGRAGRCEVETRYPGSLYVCVVWLAGMSLGFCLGLFIGGTLLVSFFF